MKFPTLPLPIYTGAHFLAFVVSGLIYWLTSATELATFPLVAAAIGGFLPLVAGAAERAAKANVGRAVTVPDANSIIWLGHTVFLAVVYVVHRGIDLDLDNLLVGLLLAIITTSFQAMNVLTGQKIDD